MKKILLLSALFLSIATMAHATDYANFKLNGLEAVGTVTANKLTDGTISIQSGAISGMTEIEVSGGVTGNSLSDGTATLTGGALSGATSVTASGTVTGGSLTDGTATLSSGSLSSAINVTASGTVTGTTEVKSKKLTLKNTSGDDAVNIVIVDGVVEFQSL